MVIYKSGSQRKVILCYFFPPLSSQSFSLLLNYFSSLFEYLQEYLQSLSKYRAEKKVFLSPSFPHSPSHLHHSNKSESKLDEKRRHGERERKENISGKTWNDTSPQEPNRKRDGKSYFQSKNFDWPFFFSPSDQSLWEFARAFDLCHSRLCSKERKKLFTRSSRELWRSLRGF